MNGDSDHWAANVEADGDSPEWANYRRREIRVRWAADGAAIEVHSRYATDWRKTGISRALEFLGAGNQIFTLGKLIDMWKKSDKDLIEQFDSQAQASLGRALYKELIGEDAHLRSARWLHLVPVASTADAHAQMQRQELLDLLLRTPWNYLAGPGENAEPTLRHALGGTIVTIDAAPPTDPDKERLPVHWPVEPKVLLVCTLWDECIAGKQHENNLVKTLTNGDLDRLPRENIRCAQTFRHFEEIVKNWHPDLIYFYGHGVAYDNLTELVFDDNRPDGTREANHVNLDVVRDVLNNNKSGPGPVVWINACQGAAISRNSVLVHLAPASSVVIANMAEVFSEHARQIAEAALPKIVFDTGPPTVFREVIPKLGGELTSYGRWGRYVIGVQYGIWNNLRRSGAEKVDPQWGGDVPNRLNRERMIARIHQNIESATGQGRSVLWHGDVEQAPKRFEARVAEWFHEKYGAVGTETFTVELFSDSYPNGDNDSRFTELLMSSIAKIEYVQRKDEILQFFANLANNGYSLIALMHGPCAEHHLEYMQQYKMYLDKLREQISKKNIDIKIFDFYWSSVPIQDDSLDEKFLVLKCTKITEKQLRDHLNYGDYFYSSIEYTEDDLFGIVWSHDQSFEKMYVALSNLIGED